MKSVILKLAASAAIIVGASPFASAADLPAKAPAAVYPVQAPITNWTGFYIGAHVGSGWGTSSADLSLDQFSALAGTPISGNLALGSTSVNGVLYGGQLGYNWQLGWVVLGIEGSISGADIDGSAACIAVIPCSSKTDMIATVTGRIGGLMIGNNLLGYIKGGWAWKDTEYNLGTGVSFGGTSVSLAATNSDTRTGYVVGAGLEYNFAPNWSGFIEYNYMDFGRDDLAFNVNITAPGTNFNTTVTSSVDDRLHVIKAGVNYKFWGGGGRWGY